MNRAAKRPNTVKQERNWAKPNNITNNYVLSMELDCYCSKISLKQKLKIVVYSVFQTYL